MKPSFLKQIKVRWVLFAVALILLLTLYIFQRVDAFGYAVALFGSDPAHVHIFTSFIVNKTLRLILNDLACMMLITAIFRERKYLVMAFYVFLFELFFLLPIYFAVKLTTEGTSEISSPLLSQVHRMIVNPTLMIILIASFFYQRIKAKGSERHV